MAIPLAVPLIMTGAGLAGSLLQKRPGLPDISGELAKIDGLFARMSQLGTDRINKESAKGRGLAASNLASRGTYRSNVAENTFNALEGERIGAISDLEANIAGQQAATRSNLLRALLGLNIDAQNQRAQQNAGRWGALTSLGANMLFPQLMGTRSGVPGGFPMAGNPMMINPGLV